MPKTYDLIASETLSVAVGLVVFSSIPQTYTDLVLVVNGTSTSGTTNTINLRFNSSSATNYSRIYLFGNGTTFGSGTNLSQTQLEATFIKQVQSLYTFNIMNYANTTTYKQTFSQGYDASSVVAYTLGLWKGSTGTSTEAISNVEVRLSASTFVVGSTFNLYGIKAA